MEPSSEKWITAEYSVIPSLKIVTITISVRSTVITQRKKGLLKTLAEKAAKNPSIHELIGCSVFHTGIKKSVQPESRFYDKNHPENNESLNTFAEREKEARTFMSLV